MHACSFLDYISTTDRLKKLLDPGGKPKVPVRFPSWLDRFFSQSGAVYTQSKITNTSLWIICFLDIHAHSRESQAMYVCIWMQVLHMHVHLGIFRYNDLWRTRWLSILLGTSSSIKWSSIYITCNFIHI